MTVPHSIDLPAGAGAAAEYLERVRGLAPIIAETADRAERERRLPPPLVAALHDAGLFRLLLPRPFGGAEIDPPAFSRIIEEVAKHDASTAWCLCQGNGCAMTAAYLEPAVAQEIWGSDPNAVLAWGPGKGEAVADGDGYRVNGDWSFASGGRHATWLGGHSTVLDADGTPKRTAEGRTVVRTMLFPAAESSMTGVWDVIGLLGTGSDNFAVRDLTVAHDHSVARDDPAERRYQAPLYQFPAMSLYAAGFSGTALGIARPMLDALKALATEKTPRLARQRLSEDGVIQSEFAQAEARLGSARVYLQRELEEVWAEVVAGGALAVEGRMRIRLAATYAIHEAKSVADTAYDLAGATAIFAGTAFERRFRDIHTLTQQLQGRKSHFRTVGAFLFGNPPDLSVV
ncbi:MAG: acyl-CoA dehydrogenase family protein [Alphaproteobacteria bacterium]|jgi:alkylation response protein AidB-like acyl-CoA dehydrogenase|nr:acyl-CoA dehydrogenase family protein [Alphaproteobacteria bacterium]